MPVLLALGAWGNRWLAPKGELLSIVDAASGARMEVVVVDAATLTPLRLGQVALAPGPGATKRLREQLRSPLLLAGNGARRASEAPGEGQG